MSEGQPGEGAKPDAETSRAHWLLLIFGTLLAISIGLYFWLHYEIPSSGMLSGETRARDSVLASIAEVRQVLTDTVSIVDACQYLTIIAPTSTPEPPSSSDAIAHVAALSSPASANSTDVQVDTCYQELRRTAQEGWISRVVPTLDSLETSGQSIPGVDWTGTVSPTLRRIREEIGKTEPDTGALQLLTTQAYESIANRGDRYFWSSGILKWAELAFWGWLGTLAFIFIEIGTWYPLSTQGRRFRDFTPWYIKTAITGPIMTLLILFLVVSTKVEISGLSLDVAGGPIELLIFLAAILGFYSRVTRKQLDLIVEKILPKAWLASVAKPVKDLVIEPASLSLKLGSKIQFIVDPPQDVVWSQEPQDVGLIKPDGTYIAPEKAPRDQKVKIIAASATDSKKIAFADVTLVEG